ncbi:Asp/Glu racemase [Brucella intermedia]|uniref:Asp/Glu racemase n=1 Tax=Brucella intermedia TaxID=94625 RepID=UPI00224B3BF7|nr:Asp/Glu racemase [Brucella intermedia]
MSEMSSASDKASLRISFLHTVAANQPLFDEAAVSMGLSPANIRHELRADLREAVEERGALTDDLRAQTVDRLLALASQSDVVVLTCATLGPAADGLRDAAIPILRADLALPLLASAMGGRTSVLCAAETALVSMRRIYEQHSTAATGRPTIIHLPHVWNLFKAGEVDACLKAIAAAVDREYQAGIDVVTFAHPWMTPAAELVTGDKRPFDIPSAALELAVRRGLGAEQAFHIANDERRL